MYQFFVKFPEEGGILKPLKIWNKNLLPLEYKKSSIMNQPTVPNVFHLELEQNDFSPSGRFDLPLERQLAWPHQSHGDFILTVKGTVDGDNLGSHDF